MKKKLLATLMVAAMSASLLAGCGSGSDTPDDSNTDAPADDAGDDGADADTDADADAPEGDGGSESASNKLTVWCWDPTFNIYAMNTAAEYYKKDHPDFELEVVETPWDDLQPMITNAATAANSVILLIRPDLCRSATSVTPFSYPLNTPK